MPAAALRAIHGQALRVWDAARARSRVGRLRDPATGAVYGALTPREALGSGWLEVGPRSYGTFTVHAGAGDRTRVRMGAYCSVALDAEYFLGGNHRPDWVSTFPFRVLLGLPGAYDDG